MLPQPLVYKDIVIETPNIPRISYYLNWILLYTITRALRTEFVLLNIPHPFHRPIWTLVTRRMRLRPFLKPAPIPALPVLAKARDTIHLTLDCTRGIICVTKHLPSERVEAVRDVAPFSALFFAKSILLHGDVDDFLFMVILFDVREARGKNTRQWRLW